MTGFKIICELAFGAMIMTKMGRTQIQADALLAYVVAQVESRDGRPLLAKGDEIDPLEIPVALEPGSRFHQITSLMPVGKVRKQVDYKIRRFPMEQAFRRLAKAGTIDTAAGPQKDFRVPAEVWRPQSGRLECRGLGNIERIRQLLSQVTAIGERRAVGYGRVHQWKVEPCPWQLEDLVGPTGGAMRPLPADWPGLKSPFIERGRVTYPYWITDRGVEQIAVPG